MCRIVHGIFPSPRLANGSTIMFTLISYLWLLFILAVLLAPMVVGLMSRPKKVKGAKNKSQKEGAEETPSEEQVLDFQDELVEMDPK